MIRLVDYGLGNVQAFLNVYRRLGIPAERAVSAQDLRDAERLILPGVGSFDHAMNLLNASGLREPLEDLVLRRRIPVLGVCVGMQMLASRSDEGAEPGLNWIPGSVRALSSATAASQLAMPHMGWNEVDVERVSHLFSRAAEAPRFYFLHSYFFDCEDPAHVVATTGYGLRFASVVSSGNIYGVQCHPEKSHHFGADLLRRFSAVPVC